MNYLHLENDMWKYAFATLQWLKEVHPDSPATNDVDNFIMELLNVFVLKMCTQAYKEIVVNKNAKSALDALVACRFGCCQFK